MLLAWMWPSSRREQMRAMRLRINELEYEVDARDMLLEEVRESLCAIRETVESRPVRVGPNFDDSDSDIIYYLNSTADAQDLFESRAGIYAARPSGGSEG